MQNSKSTAEPCFKTQVQNVVKADNIQITSCLGSSCPGKVPSGELATKEITTRTKDTGQFKALLLFRDRQLLSL